MTFGGDIVVNLYKKTVNGLSSFMGYLCGMGILVMGIILFYEVIRRYFFNAPTIWTQEISVYIFMWCMFGGSAYALQKGKHVNIDLLTVRLSEKKQSLMKILTSIAGVLFCSEVSFQAWEMVQKTIKYQKHSPTPLQVPMWIPQTALLVGFVLLTLQFAVIILDEVCFIKTGERSVVEEGGH